MRKIVYSAFLKFVAVILFVACVVFAALTIVNGIIDYSNEESDIYSFERDFSQSWFISFLLNEPENAVFNAYHSAFREYDENGNPVYRDYYDENNEEKVETAGKNIKEILDNLYHANEINYFVQWNDTVFTNCGAKSADELIHGESYSYLKRDSDGKVERSSTVNNSNTYTYLIEDIERFDRTSTIIISCSVKEEAFKEYKAMWERQESIVINTSVRSLACAVTALLMLVYLTCVCGKNKNGECKNMWIDNVWLEVHLAFVAAFGVVAVIICVALLKEYGYGHFRLDILRFVIGTLSALGGLVVITSWLSLVRNIKARRFIKSSIILRILSFSLRLAVKITKWMWKVTKSFFVTVFGMLTKKTGVILITMLFVYTALIGAFGVGTPFSPIWLLFGVILFGFACFVVANRAKDLDEIKKGVSEVRNGNVSYKIPELKCDDMRRLAGNINDIAIGLDESVAAKVKAERMKSELITNVSHDLKTPITSIISYTELLSKVDGLPEEAKDYVSVIAKKGERLKNLTQDLFDISKAQSGNDDVVLEKLDVALLINQALGEQDNEIQSSGLPFCVQAPKELYISADGRKMSRVLSNLINNILKYTMKNTRVFITAAEKDGVIEVELKNISAYPLNFNAEEITQRFVRGDKSRTAEGNGLGLAIAKSYTEICNGTFDIVVDGDMFKAILKFRKYG